MTAADLIKKLQTFPQDTKVLVFNGEFYNTPDPQFAKLCESHPGEWYEEGVKPVKTQRVIIL